MGRYGRGPHRRCSFRGDSVRLPRRADAPALRAARDPDHAADADRRFRGRVFRVRQRTAVVAGSASVRPRRPHAARRRRRGSAEPGGRIPGGRHGPGLFRVRHVPRSRQFDAGGARQGVRFGPETVVDRRQTSDSRRKSVVGLSTVFGRIVCVCVCDVL